MEVSKVSSPAQRKATPAKARCDTRGETRGSRNDQQVRIDLAAGGGCARHCSHQRLWWWPQCCCHVAPAHCRRIPPAVGSASNDFNNGGNWARVRLRLVLPFFGASATQSLPGSPHQTRPLAAGRSMLVRLRLYDPSSGSLVFNGASIIVVNAGNAVYFINNSDTLGFSQFEHGWQRHHSQQWCPLLSRQQLRCQRDPSSTAPARPLAAPATAGNAAFSNNGSILPSMAPAATGNASITNMSAGASVNFSARPVPQVTASSPRAGSPASARFVLGSNKLTVGSNNRSSRGGRYDHRGGRFASQGRYRH